MKDNATKVADMVRRELLRNPGMQNGELQKLATKLDPAIGALGSRSFHATYRLPVLRSLQKSGELPAAAPKAPKAPKAKAAGAPAAATRRVAVPHIAPRSAEALRAALHGLVREALKADDRASIGALFAMADHITESIAPAPLPRQ